MIDSRSFRQALGCFATGVTVVTTLDPKGHAVGLTVNSVTSVSLDPPLLSFCIDKKAHLFPIFRRSTTFAINILAADQKDISQHFAHSRGHPLPPKIWDMTSDECPLLKKTLAWIICRKTATYKGGDHAIILGEVTRLHKRPGITNPLLYFRSQYRLIKDDPALK